MNLRSGFTIVELIIVCTVLAILSGVTAVGYSAIQSTSRDNLRAHKMQEWANTIRTYKAKYQVYPIPTDTPPTLSGTSYCLLATSANTACDYSGAYDAAGNTTLMSELAKIGDAPTDDYPALPNSPILGPFVTIKYDSTNDDVQSIILRAPFEKNNCNNYQLTTDTYTVSNPSQKPYLCNIIIK